jgi:UDP-N-acetylglucosamine transferase subunit ALG13
VRAGGAVARDWLPPERVVIFVTVGASPLPFGRMLRAVGTLPGEDLFVQHGAGMPPQDAARAVDFLSFGEMVQAMESADVVVSHAGAGSIICALRAGHTPLVMPRLARYSETVDDHQLELARALEAQSRVVVLWHADQIVEAVASAPPRRTPELMPELPLHRALRRALHGVDPLAA